MVFLRLVWIVIGVMVAGCSSTQLNYNTADLASSLFSLMKSQIFYNLAQAINDPEFVPSQVTISIGTAQTLNAVNPTLTVPLGPSFTTANRFIQQSNPSAQFTGTTAIASPGLGIQFVDSWNQSWTMVPANSPGQLRRLRTLYQYATGTMIPLKGMARELTQEEAEKQFLCEYPIQALPVPTSPPGENIGYWMEDCRDNSGSVQRHLHFADPTFTQGHNCVLCVDDLKAKMPRLYVNPNLKYRFLRTTTESGDDMVKLGSYGGTAFYACSSANGKCPLAPNQAPFDGRRAFSDFVLFIYEAMSQPTSSGSGKASGGAAFVYSVR